MKFENTKFPDKLLQLFKKYDWVIFLKEYPYMIRVKKNDVKLDIYWNSKGYYTNVKTTLVHPKRGRNGMHRKINSISQIEKLLINPRAHTNKGYGSNKDKKGKPKK